jgi:hypothetical protein
MSQKHELTGIMHVICPPVVVSEKFTKQEFVVQIPDAEYPELIKFQVVNSKCDLLTPVKLGEKVKITFNLKGREWTNKTTNVTSYFNTLDAWKIEKTEPEYQKVYAKPEIDFNAEVAPSIDFGAASGNDDLPF